LAVELVQALASDGLRLDGALHLPAVGSNPQFDFDAVLCLHGTGSNFYGSKLWTGIIPGMLQWGAAVLAVNTRGHDLAYATAISNRRSMQGAAYEVVDECRFDVIGWLEFLAERGYHRVALLGHSSGAIKAVYAMAHDPHPAVRCVLAVSPPRLSHAHFLQSVNRSDFLDEYHKAEQCVKTGQPETLLSVYFPLPSLITAAGYIEKYGPDERYNVLKFVDRVTCPLLFTFGDLELRNVAFGGLPEALQEHSTSKRLSTAIVGGADHLYAGVYRELLDRFESWLRKGFLSQ
jgi:pimeloyl-ACP methyl ester carboxylesterase